VIDQIENHEGYDNYLSKYLAYYPLLAVTIAVSFDVGSFYALDISLFTLFSLSEHILFALEALPIAIAILLIITVLLPAMLSRQPAIQPAKPSSPLVALAWWKKLLVIVIVVLLFGVLLGGLAVMIYDMWKRNPIVLAVALLVTLPPIVGNFVIHPKFKQLYFSAVALLVCLVLSFSFGLAFNLGILTNSLPVTTVKLRNKQDTVNGRIIRSGDRGVLVYEREANLVRFIPWEGISSIEIEPTKFGEQ